MEERMKHAYSLVRQHLGTAAQRMKRQYDVRVRQRQYRKGQWVLYCKPRKYQGRQQKWQRKFSPHLIVRELPSVNYLIQKSKRSRPFITHVDKLKPWYTDNPPKSWLTANDENIDLDVILGIDDKGTAGQSPDYENLGDANSVTDTTTIERPDNNDRFRRPPDDARVIPILEVDSDSVIDITQNDDDGTTGVEQSGGGAGVEDSGFVNSDGTVGFGQGDNAGVGAMGLVNSDSGADAEWSDEVAGIGLVDSISSGNVVGVGQLEGDIGTGEVWARDDDMGTLDQQGYGKGSVSTGPGEPGNHGVGDGSRLYMRSQRRSETRTLYI